MYRYIEDYDSDEYDKLCERILAPEAIETASGEIKNPKFIVIDKNEEKLKPITYKRIIN